MRASRPEVPLLKINRLGNVGNKNKTKNRMEKLIMKNQTVEVGTKIEQKLMYSVKNNQLEKVTLTDRGFVLGEIDGEDYNYLIVRSVDPTSPKYALTASNAGLTDRKESPVKQFRGVARRENTLGGLSCVYVDKEMYTNDWEWHIELNGESHRFLYMIEESDFQQLRDGQLINLSLLTRMKPGFPSVSEKRKGDSPFMPEHISRLATLNSSNFKLASFFKKDKKDASVMKFDATKTSSRVKLAASSSKDFPLFKGFSFVQKEVKEYKKHVSTTEVSAVASSVYVLNNGITDIRIELVDDFEVLLEDELILPLFKQDKNIDIVKRKQELHRLATDGISYVDEDYALSMGLNFASGFQFRFTNVGKGLMLVIPGLKELVGVEVLLFDGSVKGDIEPYITSNQLDFAILNETRKTEEHPSLKISRQIITAIQNDSILNGLAGSTMEVLQKLYALDAATLKEFIGFCEDISVEGTEEEVLEIDNLTVELFAANPELFVQSAENKKKLYSLLDATTKKLINGRSLYLEDASIKHMAVDPYAILYFMNQGFISAVRGESNVGIRGGNTIVSGMENGDFYIEHKKAFLARYPFLHQLEGRLVNDDGGFPFNDFNTMSYYLKSIGRGGFQGVILYSLWDMNPEGQSGADFDGDTTVYTTNPIVTDNFAKTGLFLDYSLVENKDGSIVLEEGCPFPGGTKTDLETVVTPEAISYLKENGVSFDNGSFTFSKELKEDQQLLEIFADAMAEMSMVNLMSNDIGRYTNLNASVMALMDTLKVQSDKVKEAMVNFAAEGNSEAFLELKEVFDSIKKEHSGYKKLSFLMACAIRWEIDKAKHGGAYREHMEFLKAFDGLSDNKEDRLTVFNYEDTYGVSLERLLFGSKTR